MVDRNKLVILIEAQTVSEWGARKIELREHLMKSKFSGQIAHYTAGFAKSESFLGATLEQGVGDISEEVEKELNYVTGVDYVEAQQGVVA